MQSKSYPRNRYPRKALKDMTPAEQLAEQIKRVEKLGLRVVGHGTMKADGTPFFIVPSTSEKLKNMHHVVKKTARGLVCDCFASSESGIVCPHRATVYLHLKAAAEAPKPAPAQPAPKLTPERQAMTEKQRRETAILDTGEEEGFSIYKTSNAGRRMRDEPTLATRGAQPRVTEDW